MLDKVYTTEQQALKDQFHPPPDFLPEIKIQGQSVGSQNPASNLKPLKKYLSMPILDQGDLVNLVTLYLESQYVGLFKCQTFGCFSRTFCYKFKK